MYKIIVITTLHIYLKHFRRYGGEKMKCEKKSEFGPFKTRSNAAKALERKGWVLSDLADHYRKSRKKGNQIVSYVAYIRSITDDLLAINQLP